MNQNNPQIKRLLEDINQNSNKQLTVFSIKGCPACEEFKGKLGELGIRYENVDMEGNEKMWKKLEDMGGSEFVPQIMIEGNLIKDYQDVNELLSKSISEMIERKVILK
jgi:glutaredoxin|tara:strand:+ start:12031 stop:12354 length:324 start_codon:yes stop_codon:yes gene_type:complete